MPGDQGPRGPRERARIDMRQEHEVAYWTERLGVSRADLQRAVDTVGPFITAIERYLRPAS